MYINVLIVISSISFAKGVISTSSTKAKCRKNMQIKAAKLQQSKCFLPTKSTLILNKANWFDFLIFKWDVLISEVIRSIFNDAVNKKKKKKIIKSNPNAIGLFLCTSLVKQQTFEMRFWSETVFLITHTGQIFIDYNSSNFKMICIFKDNVYCLSKSTYKTCRCDCVQRSPFCSVTGV